MVILLCEINNINYPGLWGRDSFFPLLCEITIILNVHGGEGPGHLSTF